MNVVQRVRGIILHPREEWQVVAAEADTVPALYRSYILPLAALGPIALWIRISVLGFQTPDRGWVHVPVLSGFTHALLAFALTVAGVFVVALIIDALAPTFGGEKDQVRALQVAAYASTPGWVAGVLVLVPLFAILGLLAGIYGLYLLYLGLPVVMRAPPGKALSYTVVVVLVVAVLYVLVGLVLGSFLSPMGMSGGAGA